MSSSWNLKHMLAKRLLHEMILRGKGKESGIVLVVDPHTSKILSSCFRMHDLLEAGVLVLQNLCVTREKLPDLPALYFVEPTAEAIEIIIEDFPAPPPPPVAPPAKEGAGAVIAGAAAALGEKISHVVHAAAGSGSASATQAAAAAAAAHPKPKCQYLCAHLFFTRAVHPSQMKLLQRPHSIDMRRVRSFVELGLDFIAAESKVFLFDQPHWIQRLYPLPDPSDEDEEDEEDPVPNPSNQALMPLVRQLISVCLTALPQGEMPYVRHISESLGIGKMHVSKQFAELFDREMQKTLKASAAAAAEAAAAAAQAHATAVAAHAAAVAALPPGAAAPPPPVLPSAPAPPAAVPRNTTVLIVDRSLDPLTPLLHEFTFQAMLNDLLKVHGEIAHLPPPPGSAAASSSSAATASAPVSGAPAAAAAALIVGKDSDRESGELVLSEDDSLWLEYRHKHIGEVMASVNRKLKEFTSNNKMAQYQHLQHLTNPKDKTAAAAAAAAAAASASGPRGSISSGKSDSSVKDVIRAVAEMPEYKLAMKRYSKHLALSSELMTKFHAKHLQVLGEMEQSLATNTTPEGLVYTSNKDLKERLKLMVADRFTERPLGVVDKLRLVCIYAIVQGGIPEPLWKILAKSLHPQLLESMVREDTGGLAAMGVVLDEYTPQLSRDRIQELLERNTRQPLALMRFTPTLMGIMEALVSGELTAQQFPYTKSGSRPVAHPAATAAAAAASSASDTLGGRAAMGGGGGVAQANAAISKKEAKAAAMAAAAAQAALTPQERAQRKLDADAAADVAHRATGRSARRHSKAPGRDAQSQQTSLSRQNSAEKPSDDLSNGHASAASSAASAGPPPHRYIVFMLGGLSFSEMRCAYEVSAASNAPLLIGSTSTLIPSEFLLDLSGLTRKEFHARVMASSTVKSKEIAAAAAAAAAAQAAAAASAAAATASAPAVESSQKRPTRSLAGAAEDDLDDGDDEKDDGRAKVKSTPRIKADRDAMDSSSDDSDSGDDAKPNGKGKELVFESESDGEGDDAPAPAPAPIPKKKPAAVAAPAPAATSSAKVSKAVASTSHKPAAAASNGSSKSKEAASTVAAAAPVKSAKSAATSKAAAASTVAAPARRKPRVDDDE